MSMNPAHKLGRHRVQGMAAANLRAIVKDGSDISYLATPHPSSGPVVIARHQPRRPGGQFIDYADFVLASDAGVCKTWNEFRG